MIAHSRAVNALLWTVQAIVAALFLFSGANKLLSPAAVLDAQSAIAVGFLRVVAVVEVIGALGLLLPGILRRGHAVTAIAASGLVLIMCGAVGATLADPATAANPVLVLLPIVTGSLAAAVALGRGWPILRRARLGATAPTIVRRVDAPVTRQRSA
ncbi:MAG TPA: DoxX family protein [Gemmatimonadaceae bacterium]|nr:DoxX family protein [Gemmatimonadaceae bacterium]